MYLRKGCITLAENCVHGITANHAVMQNTVANSIGIVTALNPHIGYANTSAVAKEAASRGSGVIEIVLEMGLMTKSELNEILQPKNLTQPNHAPVKSRKLSHSKK